MINWILQKNLTKPIILERIKNALQANDETWEEIEVIPFSTELPKSKYENAFPVVYGSTTMMLNAYQDLHLQKGVFFDPNRFQMSNYVSQWETHLLNADGQLLELRHLENIESTLEEKWFVRPNEDTKIFSGQVDTFANLKEWSNRICKLEIADFQPSTKIWIAKPQYIIREWRLFIVDNQVISGSRYMLHGKLNESAEDVPLSMLNFVKDRLQEYQLAEVYAMDIAEVGEGYKIIECNCFNGTGFYLHDIEKVVSAINKFIRSKN